MRIRHALGETTIPQPPKRIVALGYTDQDFLYALGHAPVGVREWWGRQPFATWPWAEDERRALGAEPAVLRGPAIDVEWVLALEPDLIVSAYGALDRPTYEKLSRIAPVIAAPAGYPAWGAPWQARLRLLDQATSGGTAETDTIVRSIEAKFAEIRRRHPEFAGKSAAVADLRSGQFTLWGSHTPAVRFLRELGFRFPADLEARADAAGWIRLSLEQAPLLDVDMLLWPNGKRKEVEKMDLYRTLKVHLEDRSVWIDDPALSAAIWFQTPLSIEFVLEQLPGRMGEAVE
ncbi:ABC transporter substrate-binding protein [Amorphus sp. 3PC139-8]|uniref:ABC transporter substrate-binding protein n=1 Tax=Amorphus sp. 3PC139-8 TaxID=2735676 RepID=UPI00345C9327